jgi:hypothetical protein
MKQRVLSTACALCTNQDLTAMTAVSFNTAAPAPSRLYQLNSLLAFERPTAAPQTGAPPKTAPTPKVKPPGTPTPPGAPKSGSPGAAILFGLFIGWSLPDWWKSATGNTTSVLEGKGAQCDPKTVATNYLDNLKQDGVDQAVKAIPPKVFEWETPNGYKLSVKQGWGKDGLTYTTTLQAKNGEQKVIGPVKAQINAKGTKIPLAELPFILGGKVVDGKLVGGENFGRINLALRVGSTGLNEVEMAFTSNEGIVSTLKLKPQACGLDLTQSQILRVNGGKPADARFWAELHLAQSAKKNGGSLKAGLHDLLTVIKPSANGVYRNHGSDALGVLTKPLNALKNAGVDMRPLKVLQDTAAVAPKNSREYLVARNATAKWLTQSLSKAIDQGKIAPLNLSNAYKINYGLASVVNAQGPLAPTIRGGMEDPSSKIGAPAKRAIDANWRELQQTAAGSGYVLTQLGDGRLFAAGPWQDKPSVSNLLEGMATVLKVKKEQLELRTETHTVNGVNVKGIAIAPKVYVR